MAVGVALRVPGAPVVVLGSAPVVGLGNALPTGGRVVLLVPSGAKGAGGALGILLPPVGASVLVVVVV